MKKLISITLSAVLLLYCITSAFAVDVEADKTLMGKYGRYAIYHVRDELCQLYDTEQDQEIVLFNRAEHITNGLKIRDLYFMTDGRILYSEYRLKYPNTITESFIYEFSPETGEKTLLRSDVAILQQDIAGRFICQQVDASGDPCLIGMLDADLETQLLPFIYDEIGGYGMGLYCTRTDENGTKLTGYLNEATLEWIVPMGEHSIFIDNINRQHFIIPVSGIGQQRIEDLYL